MICTDCIDVIIGGIDDFPDGVDAIIGGIDAFLLM